MAGDGRLDPADERRASRRFAIELEVAFRTLDQRPGPPEAGRGLTINFSSRGVLFRTEQPPRTGRRVEISVKWPALLSGTCALKFVALARIVRVDNDSVAVKIEQYVFRTRRRGNAQEFLREGPALAR